MRNLICLMMLSGITATAVSGTVLATRTVSVAELEQELALPGVRHILNLRLSERLSASRLAVLESNLQNKEIREELELLADESAFLELPTAEAPSNPTPSPADQDRLLALAAEYGKTKLARWPGFVASRTVTRFEGTSTVIPNGLQDDLWSPIGLARLRSPVAQNWECPGEPRIGRRRLELIEKATIPVLYREGRSIHAVGSAGGEFGCAHGGVNTVDEFGEIAAMVPIAAVPSRADWSHWEQSTSGVLAVFHYAVTVRYESSRAQDGTPITIDISGELAVDPADGAIVRFTLIRRWQDGGFAKEYDTALEFGPIAVGEATVLGPSRRIAMYLAPIMTPRTANSMAESAYRKFQLAESPVQEYLNDVRFSGFRPYNPAESEPDLAARSLGSPGAPMTSHISGPISSPVSGPISSR